MNARQRTLARFLIPLCVWAVAPAALADMTAMEEVLSILQREGVVDAPTKERLMAKYTSDQEKAKEDAAGLLGGMEWYGDLRLRYEGFRYDEDELGNDRDNRNRFRYRARFGFSKKVGSNIKVGIRLATGGSDPRSTNQTIGGNNDFAPDAIAFDRAFVDLKIQDSGKLKTHLVGGKVSNPYTWKTGKDFLVFDGDLNMEGAYLTTNFAPSEDTNLFATFGTFIVDENSSSADPKLVALQAGTETSIGGTSLGFRVSGYEWRSLDDDFVSRGMDNGNLATAFDDGRGRMADVFAYAGFGGGDWPMTLYATAVRNFEADDGVISGVSVDEEDTAWGVGFEIGSSKKFVELGVAWFHVEANSVVGQFYDSDLFDGITNREGFIVYAARRVADNTDFKLTFFDGKEIEDDGGAAGPFATSLADADRRRLQADIEVKF